MTQPLGYSMVKVDSHQHFWLRERGDYDWLTPELKPLDRDFLPEHLNDILLRNQICKTVLVQAAATDSETDFLLSLADNNSFVAAVVGWVNFESPEVMARLRYLTQKRVFKGVRPMLQDIPDPAWILQPPFFALFKLLAKLELSFDALVTPQHLPNLHTLARQHPELKIVIDHGAKPNLAQGNLSQWRRDISKLAMCDNVFCKLSGLLTESGSQPNFQSVVPALEYLLECFGPKRVMWGSDWPVLNLAGSYDAWVADCGAYFAGLSEEDQSWVWGRTAQSFYAF
ncbi:amidohydrolase family protein [Gilvimarinus agarilyticus]|uniref:amidohydrolase family protein n=1 Tax=Gilvimarinus agarilyticus TaxID=679259 RepID=UPI0006961E3A|nr:amidohydrolase family protein [Gilvimarinus agarilyticus]